MSRRLRAAVVLALTLAACAPDEAVVTPDDVPDVVEPDAPRDDVVDEPDAAADVSVDASEVAGDVPSDAPVDGSASDVAVTCPAPAPAYVVRGGECVPSCQAAGGNTCSVTACAQLPRLFAYDCSACCAVSPPTCGDVPARWVCAPDGRARRRCANGQVVSEGCGSGACIPGASDTVNASCGSAPSVCTGSASGSSPVWTCTSDRRARQRCVSGATQTEQCPSGCVENAVGSDDTCASAPSGCAGSASGTSGFWTCTADRRARQRCVSNATQTEQCPSGCTVRPVGTDDVCATGTSGCAGSASGTTSIWTCTSDRRARQRCVSNAIQTEACTYGCDPRPTGTDDVCAPMPSMTGSGSGQVSCSMPQWWNLAYSWSPGYYAVRYGWDNDLRMVAGTPVQLRHASRLVSEGVYGWGWMPEFQDMVTGYRFRFLHLSPSRRLTTAIGTVYPAGTLVGYSGGGSADTGYPQYSTGAHLCVQTTVSYRTAFPMGTDPCR